MRYGDQRVTRAGKNEGISAWKNEGKNEGHPITKQVAPEGYVWKQNLLSREYFLEAEDTPI